MKKLSTVVLIAILVIWFACGDKKSETADIKVVEGVTYIHNPATPLHPQKTVSFEAELSIGDEEATEAAMLSQPADIAVDSDENIYVADWGDQNIKVFDRDGNYLRTIGAKGSGPGEFQSVGTMKLLWIFNSEEPAFLILMANS